MGDVQPGPAEVGCRTCADRHPTRACDDVGCLHYCEDEALRSLPIINLGALTDKMGAGEDALRTYAASLRVWARTLDGAALMLRNASTAMEHAADAQQAVRRALNGDV